MRPSEACHPGNLSELIDKMDWEGTLLGAMDQWPSCLRQAFSLIMPSHAQVVIFAGADYVALYNDAYAPTIGNKHPAALGQPAREHWSELWSDLEPLLDRVRRTGETVSAKDRPFWINRRGFIEAVYFDISYSPVRDERGTIHAIMCIVSETTERVKALDAERRLAAIVSSSTDAILGTDLDQRITAWNDGAVSLYGYTEEEILGRSVTTLVPPDRPDEENLIMAQIIRGERVSPHETQRLHKNGTVIDVSLTVSPIHDKTGTIVGASKIARDIGERKRAERLQRVLVGELNHRVKNVLATVQVVARQSFRSANREDALAFDARLRAMGQAQDLLTRQSWDGAMLETVVKGATMPFGADRFRATGPEISLPPRAVVALSMSLHELATNAAKYGALSTPSGHVIIGWGYTNQREEFWLNWQEIGGPSVEIPQRTGFGSLLIKDALAMELDGLVDIDYEKTGLCCSIRAPLRVNWERESEE